MKKNVASQVIGAQMVNATTGAAFTGAVTVSVTGDGGTQATGSVGSGACTHKGNGFHTYAPAQAETNYDHVAFTFTGTGAVPATVQVYPSFPQTGDNFSRLGAPAGASVSADVAAVKAVLPAALVSGRIDANIGAISGSTVAADNLEESTEVIGTGTCTTGGSTTSVVASAVSPTSAVNDQFNGRVIIFKGNVTAALAGQATTISDYDHATLTFTVVALTTAPASGDLFTIL